MYMFVYLDLDLYIDLYAYPRAVNAERAASAPYMLNMRSDE